MTSRPGLVPIDQIVAGLTARIDALCAELLSAGRREGHEWIVGGLDNRPGRGVQVRLTGSKAGVWCDFHVGSLKGDALDLVAHVLFGGDKAEALRWARNWLGLGTDSRPFAVRKAKPPEQRQAEQERDAEGKRQKARAIWHQAQPLAGSPADAYLAGRGIDIRALTRPPGALRFAPRCWCQEASAELPAMVAAVMREGAMVACHRTYLAEQGGRWRKAPLRAAKKVLGAYQGGFIPLARGPSQRAISEAPDDDQVAIAEGIEDALTVALHAPELRVLAGISISNLGSIILPAQLRDVLLCFDRDGENPGPRAGRERAVRWFQHCGAEVREARPPEGFKDFNAWHQAQQGSTAA